MRLGADFAGLAGLALASTLDALIRAAIGSTFGFTFAFDAMRASALLFAGFAVVWCMSASLGRLSFAGFADAICS